MMRGRRGRLGLLTILLLPRFAAAQAPSSTDSHDHPTWAIRVNSEMHRYFIDEPNCHSLVYFRTEIAHLNYQHRMFHIEAGKNTDEVKPLRIGEVAGRTIQQITHDIRGEDDSHLLLRLLVVERGPGEFCEIYHQEWMDGGFYQEVLPASLAEVESEAVLMTHDPLAGNGNWFDEYYWSFGKDGPIDLRVTERIRAIQKNILPKEFGVMNGGGFDVEKLTYGSPVWGPKDGHCCPSGGSVQIKFALKEHELVVVSQSYREN